MPDFKEEFLQKMMKLRIQKLSHLMMSRVKKRIALLHIYINSWMKEKTSQEKNKTEESSEKVVQSFSMARTKESEQSKQKEMIKPVSEPKLEKMETRGSTKIDQDKNKDVKVTPTKEKGKKEVIKVKEDKTAPKNNGKEIDKEKPLTSPPKVEDEKELQPKTKIGKTEDKELVEKASHATESDPKRKRIEANVRIGDRVKVKYGLGKQHKMYEAKVLKIEQENGKKKYYVHYIGWNMRYDEWIRKGRITEVVDGKSLATKNPKRSHSLQDSQTKAILKRSMLFASSRKHCSSSPKTPCSITLRTQQNSAPELRSTNLSETRKLCSQMFGELSSIESSDILSLSENQSELLHQTPTPSDETEIPILNAENKSIKQEELSEPEENIEERIDDLVKDENSWDVNESNLSSATEKSIKKDFENAESVKSAEIVLNTCTVNLSQESRASISSSDTSAVINKHSEILTVLDKMPPTTPESTETFLSNSPSYDQDMSSPISTSPHKDTPEAENSNLPEETSHLHSMESDDSMSQTESAILFLTNLAASRERKDSMSQTENAILFLANLAASRKNVFPSQAVSLSKRPSENNDISSPRKKVPRLYSCEPFSSKPQSSSECDKGEQKDIDVPSNAENSNVDFVSSDTTSTQPFRTSKYNFCVPLDNTMDSDERITIIEERLSELVKTHKTLKAEVAKIDRKKAKRKARESAAAVASAVNTPAQKDNADGSGCTSGPKDDTLLIEPSRL